MFFFSAVLCTKTPLVWPRREYVCGTWINHNWIYLRPNTQLECVQSFDTLCRSERASKLCKSPNLLPQLLEYWVERGWIVGAFVSFDRNWEIRERLGVSDTVVYYWSQSGVHSNVAKYYSVFCFLFFCFCFSVSVSLFWFSVLVCGCALGSKTVIGRQQRTTATGHTH